MPKVIRYDGTRLMEEEDVDREFLGRLVLLDNRKFKNQYHKGYLVAETEDSSQGIDLLTQIAICEFGGSGTLVVGCKTRGGSIHVEILG